MSDRDQASTGSRSAAPVLRMALLAIVLVVFLGGYLLAVGGYGKPGTVIYEAPYYEANIPIADSPEAPTPDEVLALTLERESARRLIVKLEYTYSGKAGEEAYTCGNVVDMGPPQYRWGCRPRPIQTGEGSVLLDFELVEPLPVSACSTGIEVEFYTPDGQPFFNYRVPYEKVWADRLSWLPAPILQMLC